MNARRAGIAPTETDVALPIAQALESGSAMASLMARLRESEARFAALAPALPDALRASVRPGPVDDTCFTLLAANGAAGAKLRQTLPALDVALDAAGWARKTIRVKIGSS